MESGWAHDFLLRRGTRSLFHVASCMLDAPEPAVSAEDCSVKVRAVAAQFVEDAVDMKYHCRVVRVRRGGGVSGEETLPVPRALTPEAVAQFICDVSFACKRAASACVYIMQ
eukprot:13376-Rhodomonas_salina.1